MQETVKARLTVNLRTAGGTLPVEGGLVRLRGNEEIDRDYDVSLLTDRSGIARFENIPAPAAGASTSPDSPPPAYYIYTLEIFKDGYFPVLIRNVSFFGGIETIQNVAMIPYALYEGKAEPPLDLIVINSAENEDL